MEEMRTALAACEGAFGRYRFDGGRLDAAEGIGPLEKWLLRVTPGPEIPPGLLATYLASLPATIRGRGADDLRAVMPRLLALAAEGAMPAALPRALAERADFRTLWPADEAAALERCLAALDRHDVEPAAAASG